MGLSNKGASDWVKDAGGRAAIVRVHVVPGAKEGAIAGVDPWRGALLVRVEARPQEGAANEEACARLARALAVPRASVSLRSGATSRDKTIEVAGLSAAEVQLRLEGRR